MHSFPLPLAAAENGLTEILAQSLLGIILLALAGIFALVWIFLPFFLLSSLSRLRAAVDLADKSARANHTAAQQQLSTINELLAQILFRLNSTPGTISSTVQTPDLPGYYFVRDGMTEGPRTEADVRRLYKSGVITDDTPAMRKGDRDWSTIGALFPS